MLLNTAQISLDKLIESSLDLIGNINKSGRIQFINNSCKEILGYDSVELIDCFYTDLLHQDDLDETVTFLQSLPISSRFDTYSSRFKHKQGHYVYMQWHGAWLEDNSSISFCMKEVIDSNFYNEKLREKDEFHRALVEYGSDLLALFDGEANFIYSSGATESILGFSHEQLVGTNVFPFIHPEDQPMVQEKLEQVLLSKSNTVISEFRFKHLNGNWVWLETRLSNQLFNPAVKALVTSTRDVTELYKSRQLLIESKRLFSSLFDDNPDTILVENREGVIIDANIASTVLHNVPKEQLIGHHVSEFLPADKVDVCLKHLEHAFDGNTVSFELETEADGIEKTYDITKIPVIVNGEVLAVHSVIKDVTQAVNNQKTVSQQAAKLKTVFQSITDAFLMLDKSWNITFINSEAEKLLQLDRKTHLKKNFWNLFPSEVGGQFYQQYHQATETGEAAHFEAFHDKGNIWIDVKAFPSTEGLSVYFSDITERVEAKQELEMLSLVASKISNGVVIADSEDQVEWVNDGFTRLTGFSLEEVIGKNPAEFLRNPKTDPKSYNLIKHRLEKGESVSFEILNSKKNGDDVWISVQVSPTLDRNGNVSKFIAIHTDITEQKQQSQLLARQKEFYESILNAVPIDVIVFDKDLRYHYLNPSSVRDREVREWLIGKTSRDYGKLRNIPVEQIQNREYHLRKAKQEQKLIEFEDNFTNRFGQETFYIRRVSPVTDSSGQLTYLISSGIDITEEKLVRRQLQQREELYRLLSENSKDTIGLHNPDGTPVYLSKSFEDLLGYKPTELEGKSPFDYVHPADQKQIIDAIEQEVVSGKLSLQVQYRAKASSGEYVWLKTDIKPLLDGDGTVVRLQTATRDITQSRHAKEALISSEKKYRELIKYTQAYMLSHTIDGEILSVNPYLLEQLGFREQDIIGKKLGDLMSRIGESSVSEYLEYMQHVTSSSGVINILNKQQERRALYYRNFRVEESGEQPYIIGIAQDMTERMLMEEELRKAKLEAEESSRVKEHFLANMSHEIRTPLNGIIGMAGLMNKTKLDQLQQNYLGIIKRSSDNLLVIINDILDIAKMEAGKLELEQIAFNLTETVSAAFKTLQYRAEEKELNYILTSIPELSFSLMGDPYRLNQVLLNLLSNAIKFTESGCVTLSIEIVDETENNVSFQFLVKDTGIGIPESKIQSIFEEFSQAYTDTTRKHGGTGLGLNICRSLVEMQNGNIWVVSEVGKGSDFKFRLSFPKSYGNPGANVDQELNFSSLENVHIMLAEDNEVNIFLAESILKGWGAKVDVAVNGKKAVELVTSNDYDLILMDIQMPEMNGLEATQLIRQLANSKKASVPIIALTANAIKGDAEKYMAAGMDGYVSKPFDEETLYLKIKSLLRVQGKEPTFSLPTQVSQAEPGIFVEVPLYNLDMLHKMARGNEAIMSKTINLFFDSTPRLIDNLLYRYNQADWPSVGALAHQLKPNLELLGISSLYDVIREIEHDAKEEKNLSELKTKIDLVFDVASKVIRSLKENF